MSILVDAEILEAIESGDVKIDPFDIRSINPNSVDLRLGNKLVSYEVAPDDGFIRQAGDPPIRVMPFLDPRRENLSFEIEMPKDGFILRPGKLYLAHTYEVAGSTRYVPMIEGKSSIARLGLFIHVTAGFGDIGFVNRWTLELATIHPIMVYPGMRICQIYFYKTDRMPNHLYEGKYMELANGPVASRSYEESNRDS